MARIKISGRSAVYHCISRVVGGQLLLGELEKERLRQMLWQQAAFSGVEVITYCVMSNHFHLLARVPAESHAPDGELVKRASRYYGRHHPYVLLLRESLETAGALPEDLRANLHARMGDVSVFMKELKQRFSKWFNRRGDRFGTLWAERFKSVLVEDTPGAVQAVAAYIDLNPVRAGLVLDPREYRWCGYGEAVGGSGEARRGLTTFYAPSSEGTGLTACRSGPPARQDRSKATEQVGKKPGTPHEDRGWEAVSAAYRRVLLVRSGTSGSAGKATPDLEALRRELRRGGRIPLGEVLRLRIRYFSDGVVLGSREYVNAVFSEFRGRFGAHRRTGARPMRGVADLGAWSTMRDLQVDVVGG